MKIIKINEQLEINPEAATWAEMFNFDSKVDSRVNQVLVSDHNISKTVIDLLEEGNIKGLIYLIRLFMCFMPLCKCHLTEAMNTETEKIIQNKLKK